MGILRTIPPANYLTPSREEMRVVAKRVGLKAYSADFAIDLAHMAAGCELVSPSEYETEVWQWTRDRLKDGQNFDEKFQKSMAYHRNVGYFLQSVQFSSMPGATPLEKAMATLKLLSQQSGGGSAGDGTDSEPLPIFAESEETSPEQTASNLLDTIEVLESLSDTEKEMLDPEGEVFSEDDNSGDGDLALSALRVAEKLQDGTRERLILEICRMLDEFTNLNLRKTNVEKPDPEGESIRMRRLKSLTELNKLPSPA